MPWGVDDVDRFKKGLTAKQKRQWVAIANSALKSCMDDGGSEEVCAASAIRQANGVVGNEEIKDHRPGGDQTYASWRNMIQRCHNSNAPDYEWYGGRGIKVVQRWRDSYEAFLEDMGPRPAGKTLHRKNRNGDYSKSNCEWRSQSPENHEVYRTYSKNYGIRYEDHQGKRHMVVPVVMMVVGVHRGSHGPMLHLEEELGKVPGAWNGIPISVQHPEEGGQHISANYPEVIDNQVVGRIYNTHMDSGKLRAEAWLDEQKLQNISPEAFEYIKEGKPLEVSVGVFTDDDLETGEWQGEHYEAVARNHRPDHLALLPGGVGACSWADGCGVRTHQESGNIQDGYEDGKWKCPTLDVFGIEGGDWENLDHVDKSFIASHYLVGSAYSEKYEELSFPFVNPATGLMNVRALKAVITEDHYRDCNVKIPEEVKEVARKRLAGAGLDIHTGVEFATYCPPVCGGPGGGGGGAGQKALAKAVEERMASAAPNSIDMSHSNAYVNKTMISGVRKSGGANGIKQTTWSNRAGEMGETSNFVFTFKGKRLSWDGAEKKLGPARKKLESFYGKFKGFSVASSISGLIYSGGNTQANISIIRQDRPSKWKPSYEA